MKYFFASALLLASFASAGAADTMKTVEHVDLQRYSGKWYEVARIPNRFQKSCTRDVTAEYSLQGSTVEVRNACVRADGSTRTVRGKARITDKASNAKLKVTFFWPFSGDYWVLGLDPEYRWAVVGGPSRKYLWILSRTKALSKGQMEDALRVAERNGYAKDRIMPTEQTRLQ